MRRLAALIAIGGVILLAWEPRLHGAQFGGQDPILQTRAELTSQKTTKLDINTAGIEALLRLPGMTPQLAEQIIRNRPYHKLDDLITRKVLGKKQFARIREFVMVSREAP
jgi:DNA uptake protein ComE-like DNA-binding protein